jgi:hypothetical protein
MFQMLQKSPKQELEALKVRYAIWIDDVHKPHH